MTDAAEILVVQQLDKNIYASNGGGQIRVINRHASGPRGLSHAGRSMAYHRNEARKVFGTIGAGQTWLEIVKKGGKAGSGISLSPMMNWITDAPPAGASYQWWQKIQREYDRALAAAEQMKEA